VALIKSISGIRGTIGGKPGESLSPVDLVKFTAAFGSILQEQNSSSTTPLKIVVGRDARISGEMIRDFVNNTLMSLGFNVIDLGLSTTPTVELAVTTEKADGGIILTASHNPKEWNALKLLNKDGEFISAELGAKVLDKAAKEDFVFASVEKLGCIVSDDTYLQKHVDAVANYPLVNAKAI